MPKLLVLCLSCTWSEITTILPSWAFWLLESSQLLIYIIQTMYFIVSSCDIEAYWFFDCHFLAVLLSWMSCKVRIVSKSRNIPENMAHCIIVLSSRSFVLPGMVSILPFPRPPPNDLIHSAGYLESQCVPRLWMKTTNLNQFLKVLWGTIMTLMGLVKT